MERRQETKIVKVALKNAGHTNCRVKHGSGTAWGWLDIYSPIRHHPECSCTRHSYGVQETSPVCSSHWRKKHDALLDTTLNATGRYGEYNGNVNVHLDFDSDQYDALPVVD